MFCFDCNLPNNFQLYSWIRVSCCLMFWAWQILKKGLLKRFWSNFMTRVVIYTFHQKIQCKWLSIFSRFIASAWIILQFLWTELQEVDWKARWNVSFAARWNVSFAAQIAHAICWLHHCIRLYFQWHTSNIQLLFFFYSKAWCNI